MSQRKEYRQILIELMCIDQQSKKNQVPMSQRKVYRQILIELMCKKPSI